MLDQKKDYTMVTKTKGGYLIENIYPNEDTNCPENAITLWTSHHLYNPETDGSIDNFTDILECKAYLEEGPTVETFIPSNAKWYKSQKDIEEHLSDLKIGDVVVAPYK